MHVCVELDDLMSRDGPHVLTQTAKDSRDIVDVAFESMRALPMMVLSRRMMHVCDWILNSSGFNKIRRMALAVNEFMMHLNNIVLSWALLVLVNKYNIA